MSLIPAIQINFDGGGGLAADDDYILDADGIGHFHPVKAGSTWVWRLVFVGVNTTAAGFTFSMDVRSTIGSATEILSSDAVGDDAITITADPDGDNTEEVEFTVSAAGTALLQSQGAGMSFVYDIHVTAGGETDRWVTGSGTSTPAVTR